MKILAITAALLLSSAAFAQSTPPGESASPSMPATEMPAPVEAQTAPSMPDSMSTPATPAAPLEPTMAQPVAAPMPAPQAEYPRCSRTVVDQCMQGAARERDTKRRPRRR